MCYYIIQNIIETIRHLVPRLLLQRFGRWSLGTNLTLALPRRRTECRLDFHHVTVSRGHNIMAPAGPSVRSNVRLSVALCDRPESREGRSIWKSIATWPKTLTACNEQISYVFFPWLLTYVDLRSHARESESA